MWRLTKQRQRAAVEITAGLWKDVGMGYGKRTGLMGGEGPNHSTFLGWLTSERMRAEGDDDSFLSLCVGQATAETRPE